ncbi:hypothetical protein [Deefgea rivuli]|uniref:hypothetical protein n=1 Tax=Deefgea rivuli TaxID=400948 RepID=UPI000488AADE|nr:hypothetical protein [Deefgea rivuli]
MKKSDLLLAIAAATVATSASAITVCTGATTPQQVAVATGAFIQQGFNMNCSKNVKLDYADTSSTVITVTKACSTKGKTLYSGSSDGGSLTGAAGTC